MSAAITTCPNCGTRKIRAAQSRTLLEQLFTFFGIYPLRCLRCKLRFKKRIWQFSDVRFARCPRCFRLDLTTWCETHYNPPFGTILRLRLGARPYRCEVCRCNFASYRALKYRFRFQPETENRLTESETLNQ